MREILFRAKRKDNGEWVQGFYFERIRNYAGLKTVKHCYIKYESWDEGFITYEVVPETVGQFIGLMDKNGKRVFEGDVVRYCDEDAYYYQEDCTEFFGKVVQECGAFGIGTYKELPLELNNWCNNDNFVSLWEIYWNLNCCDSELPMLEVIGNCWDNPELLQEVE